jgi:peroxiredoxin
MIKPRQPVPVLDVPLVGGGRWLLSEQRPERFTMLVFYRGVHCPVCREYVTKLNSLAKSFKGVGVTSLLAVSGDEEWRAQRAVSEWNLDQIRIGYGQSPESMRQWGLYRSKAIKEGQPNDFGETGLFIIRPDRTLYAAVYNTMPFLRPALEEVVKTIQWVNENDYPARGEL